MRHRRSRVYSATHEKSADEINKLTPKRYKEHAHEWLIQHGMKVCKARSPQCEDCPLTALCDYYRENVAA